jgi:DNA-binding ferritin-like protein
LHELFDEIADELLGHVDVIAARHSAWWGGIGNSTHVGLNSRLAEYPEDMFDSMEVVAALADRFSSLATTTREAIEVREQAEDMDTSDLFIDVSQ